MPRMGNTKKTVYGWSWLSGIMIVVAILCCHDLFGQTITLKSPSYTPGKAPETTLAPTRDFMITGTVTGEHVDTVKNLTFSLYKKDADGNKTGDPVRTIMTNVFTQNPDDNLDYEFDQIINTRIESQEAETAALKKNPMPDLVFDSTKTGTERDNSILDPTNKAVLYNQNGTMFFAATVLGGATKDFHTDYGTYDDQGNLIKYDDLSEGDYVLEVTAYDEQNQVVSAQVLNYNNEDITNEGLGLSYAPSNLVFSRYGNPGHEAKLAALANLPENDKDKYKIMLNYFPGYWTQAGTFAELLGRWEENDWIEYQYAPKTLGMIYNIDNTCATLKEIYRIIDSGNLENGAVQTEGGWKLGNQVYLYHYDYGDESLAYTRRDGSTANVDGKLVLFNKSIDPTTIDINKVYDTEEEALEFANNKYMRLDLTRVDLYGADADPDSIGANIDRINDIKKQVSLVQNYSSPEATVDEPRSMILAKTDQSIGLFGAITPLNATITKVPKRDISLYGGSKTVTADVVEYKIDENNDTWIKSIHYEFTKAQGEQIEGNVAPGLVRTMSDGWVINSPSIFEFKALLDEDSFGSEGRYTLSIWGKDRNGIKVDRTEQDVDILITRTGVLSAANMQLTGNQLSVGDAVLDMLIENNAASPNFTTSYMNAPKNEAAQMLSQLASSQTVASISKLAFNPLTTSINRLDSFHNTFRETCGANTQHNLWATYIHHGQNTQGIDEIDSFDVSGNGMAVGYDRAFDYGRMGAAFVYENSVNNGNRMKNELDDMTAVAYGKVNINGLLWFNGLFGYSWRNYRTDRSNTWTNFAERLAADFDGKGVWANFRLERDLFLAHGTLTPFIGYEANWNTFDQYKETGGVSALAFDKRTEDYGFLQAGVRTNFSHNNFDLGLRIMYVHRLSGPDRAQYVAALSGNDNFAYSFSGLGVLNSTDFADLNLDLQYRVSEWTNLFTGYNGLYGNRSSGHMLTAGLNTQW